MRCIVHIWNSIDCEGNRFVLCLSPLHSLDGGAPTEAFISEKGLSARLADLGFEASAIRKNLTSLRESNKADWSHVEVAQSIFDGFGRQPKVLKLSEPSLQLTRHITYTAGSDI